MALFAAEKKNLPSFKLSPVSFFPNSASFYPKSSHWLMDSYQERASFSHFYEQATHTLSQPRPCVSAIMPSTPLAATNVFLRGINSIEFDNEGRHVVSLTNAGCINIHNFDELYTQANEFNPLQGENDVIVNSIPRLHTVFDTNAKAVMWNQTNQNQIAFCTSNVELFDVDHFGRAAVLSGYQPNEFGRMDEIAMSSNGLIAACGNRTFVWDPRQGNQPIFDLRYHITRSLQFDAEDYNIFLAGRNGKIHIWDIRASRVGADIDPRHIEVDPRHIEAWEVPPGDTFGDGIRTIRFNPCCPSQLGFLTDGGGIGILDTIALQITHRHLLPPRRNWLYIYPKPSWLHACSVLAMPIHENIRLLDFHSPKSSLLEDYRDVLCSQLITACTAHPSYNAIVAGNERNSLVIVSQRKSRPEEEEE